MLLLLLTSSLLLILRSYDHALDPESGSVDEVSGCHRVFFGAPKLVSQRCPDWPVSADQSLASACRGQDRVKRAQGSVGLTTDIFCLFYCLTSS